MPSSSMSNFSLHWLMREGSLCLFDHGRLKIFAKEVKLSLVRFSKSARLAELVHDNTHAKEVK